MLYWLILLVFIIIIALSINDAFGYISEVYFVLAIILGGAMLFAAPIIYMDEVSNLQSFKSTKETVLILKEKENIEFEKATMARDIIEANQWLAKKQYWESKFWFGTTIPNEVMELEKINY